MTQSSFLAGDIYFGEGPRWHDGRLWFSDFHAHAVKAVDTAGHVEVVLDLGRQQPSGLGWLPDGRLLVVSMLDRSLLRVDPEGPVVHADLSSIATFYCNDMVVDASGRAYVGNFGFDLDGSIAERGVQSVLEDHATAAIARVDPDGTITTAATDMHFPNGSVITPDGRTLIVAETLGFALTAFDVADDGGLSNRRVWAPLGARLPDGICLDADGHVWVANPLAPECFLVAEGGEVLEVIDTQMPCYACMLGGDDGQTLFMLTAPSSSFEIAASSPKGVIRTARVDTPHAGLP